MSYHSFISDNFSPQTTSISIQSSDTSSSSKNIFETFMGSIFGGAIIGLTGAANSSSSSNSIFSGKSNTNNNSNQNQNVSIESQANTQLAQMKLEVIKCDSQLESCNKNIADLQNSIPTDLVLNAQKTKIDELEKELKDKKTANEIILAQQNVKTADQNVKTAQTNLENASQEIQTYESNLANAKSVLETNPNDEADKTAKDIAEKGKKQAETKKTEAQTKLNEANQKQAKAQEEFKKLDTEKNQELKSKIEQYNQLKSDYTNGINTKATKEKQLADAQQTKSKLEEQKNAYQNTINDLSTQITNYRGTKDKAIGEFATLYADNSGSADGNWWKRNMPTWLGGSNAKNKAKYKQSHQLREKAEAGIEQLGGNKATISGWIDKNAVNDATRICKSDSKYENYKEQATKYLEQYPNATDEAVKVYLNAFIKTTK